MSRRSSTAQDYVNLVTVRGGGHAVAGTLVGLRGEPRIVMIDDLSVDLPPAEEHADRAQRRRPGMIAAVTGALADAGINVGDMHLGHSVDGAAAMQVLATNVPVDDDVAAALRAVPGIVSVHSLATD